MKLHQRSKFQDKQIHVEKSAAEVLIHPFMTISRPSRHRKGAAVEQPSPPATATC